ncbi:asparagine synthase (glutamine-hydrolyzing) [Sporosarcina sp. ACRSL]|uniref:asparagine synthase (glutamine-hydrolyzing) n=1 Tax=Sporosarcina sp. ACRSL TaxID=2918215 RepID=UPI001EF6638A|nr:asparagine synthase (glutamine-hydrolyzing) [Sporosarcina sp. ACRSL]MCG7345456.1 asparagine synthase (glutamine-hydrolyzing) [Sporosarcina sp. ACRSL]
MCDFTGILNKPSAEVHFHHNDLQSPLALEGNSKKIAYNGKLYNTQELKKKLEKNNHQFQTNSDSEIILKLYEEYAEDFIQYLHGTFAIAIWDETNKELVMIRDRVGKKPYYYSNGLDQLLFGTELKKIVAQNGMLQKINFEAVENFLRFYYIPQPMTIFENVYQLMPGHMIKYSLENDMLTIKKYWDINQDVTEKDVSYPSLQQRLRETLTSSVRERMGSEESAGAFLSGGIDSSIVVGLLAEQSTNPVNTFTIGYKDHKQYDESVLAKTVSKLHNTIHHELFIEFDDLHEVIETIIGKMEEPFADSSAIPTYYVSRLTKNHTSVALSGDGGDELFAGYKKYTSVYYQQMYSKIPKMIKEKLIEAPLHLIPEDKRNPFTSFATKAKKFMRSANTETFQMHVKLMESYDHDQISRLVKNKSLNRFNVDEQLFHYFHYLNTNEPVNRMMYTDFKFALPNDMLVKTDRMSKINGLEIRSPFLDHKVVELAYEIPLKYKMRRTQGKIILKETFSDLLPKDILTAKKRGFEIPLNEWFKNELKELVASSLSKEKVEQANLVHFHIVEIIIEEHMKGKKNHANLIWSLIVLHKWYENFLRHVEGGEK